MKGERDGRLPPGFYSDSNLDYFGDTSGHWTDIPFETYASGQHVNQSLMQEFVVGIGYLNKARAPVPEFGGLYFLVVIDVALDRYRVLMSLDKRLSGPEILEFQRLVRKICTGCKTPYEPSEAILRQIGLSVHDVGDKNFYYGTGCDQCNRTGYKGRTAICELLDLSDRIREMILDRKPTSEIKKAARDEGMRFLRECAVERVTAGISTLREINKVTFVE